MKILYRLYSGPGYEGQAYIWMDEFHVTKSTPQGDWILDYGKKRFVKHTNGDGSPTRKRFAYETKELAVNSFVHRKRKQLSIMTHQIKVVEAALKQASAPDFVPQKCLAFRYDGGGLFD